MNVEIGTEVAQFAEKEYVIGIFLAVRSPSVVPVFSRVYRLEIQLVMLVF